MNDSFIEPPQYESDVEDSTPKTQAKTGNNGIYKNKTKLGSHVYYDPFFIAYRYDDDEDEAETNFRLLKMCEPSDTLHSYIQINVCKVKQILICKFHPIS